MMVSIESYVRQGRSIVKKLLENPKAMAAARMLAYIAGGFVLSAASLGNAPQPLCLGLLCAAPTGWPLLALALGSSAGYLLFWGSSAMQGLVWVGCGLMAAGLLSGRRLNWHLPMLMPAVAALIVSASGCSFQLWLGDTTAIPMYVLRVVLAGISTRVFTLAFERRSAIIDWLVEGIGILALSQLTLTPWLGLGYVGAAVLAVAGAFPAAALAGLALDLSQVTVVPMTAVLCGSFLVRLVPKLPRRLRAVVPTLSYILVMSLCGLWDMKPLPGLLIGGLAGIFLPEHTQISHRRGELGVAQVRLELVAGVLAQMEEILLETPENPIDEQAIVAQSAQRACGSCPCRKGCQDREYMPAMSTALLHKPGLQTVDIPIPCRKVARMTAELQRGQAQMRAICADREQQREYREATLQQYQFLATYLQGLSDDLGKTMEPLRQQYEPEVAVCSLGKEQANGDRCLWFAGTGCRYYVLLCDGMGTGLGAAREAKAAGSMLRRLLSAGFPPEYALRSLNSLCTLRGRAGAVTVDLAEIRLDNGSAVLYKWGAMPSYLVSSEGTEKIGTAGAPPGLSVTEGRETVDRLSLRRGEKLVMLSDGVSGEDALRRARGKYRESPGETAASLLETVDETKGDDATAAVVRLRKLSSATQ